jgi:2-dehydro-3-deoxyphosphogluconate aldolase/(4S)-4-hydroxy-2-oxoglutarate aldolase
MKRADAFPEDLAMRLADTGTVAVLIIDQVDHAVPLARALHEGGVTAMELTLRTDAALEALTRIRSEVPEMIAGVGTVLSPQQVDQVARAGGQFAVAPGLNRRVVQAARQTGLPFAPGVCTPSDIEAAVEEGCRLLKFFPCEPIGGLEYLRSVAAPFQHLGLKFVPLGGVNAGNLREYLSEPSVCCVGGSWIAPRRLIERAAWAEIAGNARQARRQVDALRQVRTA